MTRTSDQAVSLERRAAMAEEYDADLFVSVHVNAVPSNPRPFVETYYFKPRRRYRRNRIYYSAAQWELRNKLADQSALLAEQIQESVLAQVRKHNEEVIDNGVRTRGFTVLRRVAVPAVLAELTVLTAPEEEERLRTEAYLDELARGLESGIMAYLQAHAISGNGAIGKLESAEDVEAWPDDLWLDLYSARETRSDRSGLIGPAP